MIGISDSSVALPRLFTICFLKDRLARHARRDPQPQLSQSRSLGYQTLLPLLSAFTSPEFGSSGQAAQEMFVFFSHLFSRCVLLSSFVSLFCFFIVLWDLPDPRLHQREQGFLKLRDRLISLALFISLRNPWVRRNIPDPVIKRLLAMRSDPSPLMRSVREAADNALSEILSLETDIEDE